jgi:hypothetical protein
MFGSIRDSFVYPVKGQGLLILFIGSAFAVICGLLSFAPLLGGFISLFASAFFLVFFRDITVATMDGNDNLPNWPDISDPWNSVIQPAFTLLLGILVTFLPLIAYILYCAFTDTPNIPAVGISLLVLSCIYLPLSYMLICRFDAPLAPLNIHIGLAAAFKAFPFYVVSLVFLILAIGMTGLVAIVAHPIFLLGEALAAFVYLYLFSAFARFVGHFFIHQADPIE